MRLDLADLRLLVSTIETGSITAGAARCHLSLAAASARLRAMESTLGAALLERGPRGTLPTAAGATALHHARAVLARMARLQAELAPRAGAGPRRVRLLANTTALAAHLPAPLASFLDAHADIDVDTEARPSHAIVQALVDGRGDLGVVADSTPLRDLEARPFRDDPLVVVAARDATGASDAPRHFADLLDAPMVALAADAPLQQHLELQAAALGRALRIRVRVADFAAACMFAARGAGVAILPRAAFLQARERRALVAAPLRDAWANRRLLLCARDFQALDPTAHALADHLANGGRR